MRRITVGILIALCAITSPDAQAPPRAASAGKPGAVARDRDHHARARRPRNAAQATACARNVRRHAGRADTRLSEVAAGEHAPDGAIDDLVGLKFSAGGKTLSWRRDPVDQFAFHLDVPQGVDTLDVSLDFLSAIGAGGFSSASSETAHLGIYSWNQVAAVPAGRAHRRRDVPRQHAASGRVEIRDGAAGRQQGQRQDRFRARVADDAGGFTCHRRANTFASCRSTPPRVPSRPIWLATPRTRSIFPTISRRSGSGWCRKPTRCSARATIPTITSS